MEFPVVEEEIPQRKAENERPAEFDLDKLNSATKYPSILTLPQKWAKRDASYQRIQVPLPPDGPGHGESDGRR